MPVTIPAHGHYAITNARVPVSVLGGASSATLPQQIDLSDIPQEGNSRTVQQRSRWSLSPHMEGGGDRGKLMPCFTNIKSLPSSRSMAATACGLS